MGESIRTVDYFYMESPDQPGEAARVLDQLRKAGVNLLVFSGFPAGRKAQLDFVPENSAAFRSVAKAAKWKLNGPKKGFLIQGDDRVGAGGGRYGVILWVKPRDVKKAATALGAS